MKKITIYVNEEELGKFDSKIPREVSRSELLRGLMNHYTYLRTHNLAEGIIVAKPTEEQDAFLIHLTNPYIMGNEEFAASGIVRIATAEILKHNLELGDTVKLCPSDGAPI